MRAHVEHPSAPAGNPYAPMAGAATRTATKGAVGFWRDGDELVLTHAGALPQRCVKCNRPAPLPLAPSRVHWHRDWIYSLAILNPIIYLIVALDARETGQVAAAVCGEHVRARRLAMLLGWGGFAGGLGAILYGIWEFDDACIALGALTTVVCSVMGLLRARIVYPTRIDANHIRLKGCGARFLDSLPAFLRSKPAIEQ